MASVNLSAITVPTPEPYDDKDPQRQAENLCYVLNQLLAAGKAAGWAIPDPADVLAAIEALPFQNFEISFGDVAIRLGPKTATVLNA